VHRCHVVDVHLSVWTTSSSLLALH
jgi:hypothetical protein